MIQFSIKTERVIWFGVLLILGFFTMLKQCNSTKIIPQKTKITIVKDTIWQTKTDTFKVQTTQYKTVYVTKKDTTILKEKPKQDSIAYFKAKVYKDTLSNDDIDIYTHNLVEGSLLDSELSYKLKVPREITITKTIEHPKSYKSGLYLFSEIGGNANKFDNFSLGAQYNRKGNWFISYRVNLNQLNQTTHNVGVGFRVF